MNLFVISKSPLYSLTLFYFILFFIFSNKFIVKYFGITVFGKYIYIILEYASGGDVLEYILNNGAFDEVTTAKVK